MAETMTELFTAFTGFREELKASLDKQAKELKANGESSEKTGKRVEEVGEKLVEVKAELDRRAAEIQARIDEVEKLAARPRMGVAAHNGKSIGQQFAESDQIKAMRASAATESGAFSVNGSFFPRAAITSDAGSAGTLVEPQRLPDVVTAPRSRPLLRDLLQVSPTTSGTIEFIEQTGFTNNAAPVAEGAVKPESNLTFAKRTAPVEVIAHWAEITRQIIADAPRLQATLDGEMRAGLELKEDEQFIRGSGSSPNLQGIATHPRVQKYFWATGNNAVLANATIKAKTGDTKLDAIRRAMLTVTVAKYFATGLVLNPIDFADIELLKG
ncbi:phage major capsid protein, partial [Longimicrobium sp.]|uniref:phage major capsid protein n=1 Tax=Longimicrobium sp. TaxID=2029185 RepID=UPI002F937D84